VPAHQVAGATLVGDRFDRRGDVVEGRDTVEHPRHALELDAKRFQSCGPPLGQLASNRVGVGGRMLGPGRGRRGEQLRLPLELAADLREELGPSGHRAVSRSDAQRS
jgi:hypothetical protein